MGSIHNMRRRGVMQDIALLVTGEGVSVRLMLEGS